MVTLSGAIAVAAVVGAVGWMLVAYNEVTKVDRSNPKVVADHYLRAIFNQEDRLGAELYACDDRTKLKPIDLLLEDLESRERVYGVEVLVDWEGYRQTNLDNGIELSTKITVTAMKDGIEQSSSAQDWSFLLTEDDGWRVCAAERRDRDRG